MNPREEWQAAFEASKLRDAPYTTMSGIPLEPVYGPDDGEFPGVYPYTRGPYASMYRSKLWTMRMFAGFGTAEDTNWRFKEILRAGGDGLSTAFDMPTLLGHRLRRPDGARRGRPLRRGRRHAWPTWRTSSPGSTSAQITTSMTINSPAAVLLAMYVAQAEKAGVDRARLGGTLQNDILKEYQAQKEFVFPPRPSMRLVRDTITFRAAEMPRWHSVSISGYHIREAGSTAAEELAFTLANGFAYVELALQAGLPVDAFAPRLSFFFNAHIDFFEEIAKYRAARRIWARWMKERYGAPAERSMQLRFHTQTAGVSLTAQQPEVNIVRTAIEALAGVLGGTQTLHTNSMDEALALPTEKAARIALRTQQVHRLRDGRGQRGRPARRLVLRRGADRRDGAPGRGDVRPPRRAGRRARCSRACIQGIEDNWFQGRIADSAYELERTFNEGRRHRSSASTGFTEGNDDDPIDILQITNEDEARQLKRLDAGPPATATRPPSTPRLARLQAEAADPEVNLMPALIDAVEPYATLGEIMKHPGRRLRPPHRGPHHLTTHRVFPCHRSAWCGEAPHEALGWSDSSPTTGLVEADQVVGEALRIVHVDAR